MIWGLLIGLIAGFVAGYVLAFVRAHRRSQPWREAFVREEERNAEKDFPWPHDVACPVCKVPRGYPCSGSGVEGNVHGGRLEVSPGAIQAKYGGPLP